MSGTIETDALVIGAGPAGLMAAEVLGQGGARVVVVEARPSAGRKFLMAGKSGLNLTHTEPFERFVPRYFEAADRMRPILRDFDPDAVQVWARGLGQAVFTGSSGRVFPVAMKASPLLRAWLGRLDGLGVDLRTRWRFTGFEEGAAAFDTPSGRVTVAARAVVLAMGGASWARLGSDGAWADVLKGAGVAVTPFAPANAGLCVDWSAHMARWFGAPVKGVRLMAGAQDSRGEFVISESGLEGGGIYSVSRAVRDGAELCVDLLADLDPAQVTSRLARPRGKASMATHLRKTLKLEGAKAALLQEFARPLPDGADLAALIKALPVRHAGLRPLDQAISVAGGIAWAALDEALMLRALPGVFAAGEMLDWEAPTGGYLLQGCFATGHRAGTAALRYLKPESRAAATG